MHTTYLTWIVYIYISCISFYALAATETVSSAHLLPDSFSAFGDYEVLSVKQDHEEDVVRIRKRAGEEDCSTDCLDYSGWTEDGRMHCENEDVPSEDVPDKRSILEKRDRKMSKFVNVKV